MSVVKHCAAVSFAGHLRRRDRCEPYLEEGDVELAGDAASRGNLVGPRAIAAGHMSRMSKSQRLEVRSLCMSSSSAAALGQASY